MGSNAVFFGWNRPIPGREHLSAGHFQDFVKYLEEQQQKDLIQSYEVVILNSHGGDMNGFFLIRGENDQLDTLVASEEWENHMIRAGIHLEGSGAIRGLTGDLVVKRMELWTKGIPA